MTHLGHATTIDFNGSAPTNAVNGAHNKALYHNFNLRNGLKVATATTAATYTGYRLKCEGSTSSCRVFFFDPVNTTTATSGPASTATNKTRDGPNGANLAYKSSRVIMARTTRNGTPWNWDLTLLKSRFATFATKVRNGSATRYGN